MGIILSVRNVTMTFGGLVALRNISLEVDQDFLLSVIGPNGSGKTTLFNVITGIYSPTSGEVWFSGENLTGRPPYQIAAKRITRTFQNINLFDSMTVLENVIVGQHSVTRSGLADAVFRTRRHRDEERETRERAAELVDFVGLGNKAHEIVRNLPYGEQKRLEIARALAARPRLILLDEPTAGLNPSEKSGVADLIRAVHRQGISIILIEHDMRMVMGLSDRIVVIDHGEQIADGTPEEIRADTRVIEAYLGKQAG